MDWMITASVLLSVLIRSLCFNIDPVAWRSWSNDAAGFGYQVVQRQSDVLVSAPLAQYSPNSRGQIYKCFPNRASCQDLQVPVPDFAVNMSLGLTMTSDPATQNTAACGPTIPKDCKSITMYNGACFHIGRDGRFSASSVPFAPPECRVAADIAFLLDGSGSVAAQDFRTMKEFVKKMVRPFVGKETQFAVVQFSDRTVVHYYFNNFFTSGRWESNIDGISQERATTYTAAGIEYVVRNVFTSTKGSRPNVKKILIVITDGVSHDRHQLPNVADLAQRKQIVRFAIGVGNAFNDYYAKEELNKIASSPSAKHMFRVESFDALEEIRKNLEEKLFSIEGSQSSGESLKMEMAQEGFSAAYVPGGFQMGIVGANQWKGGYMKYTFAGEKLSSIEPDLEQDSYLGYSMAVAKTRQGPLTIVGAPRNNHIGAVLAVQAGGGSQRIEPLLRQSGEYFGAEVCAMDVDGDSYTDLILISAPMYKDTDREGRVYVCSLTRLNVECRLDSPLVLRGDASDNGRFGSSLAVLPDLNTDSLSDVAVGAPLENDGQGCIYIFHGEGGGSISSPYSQRIAAAEVQPGLKWFGVSISQLSLDHSGDSLPDLAVGSNGTVVLLRSKPIVMVDATVSFSLNQIPTQKAECSVPLRETADICFTMKAPSTSNRAEAKINYTLILDATRKVPNNRAYISDKQREITGSIDIQSGNERCNQVNFFIEACPEDALNALNNELTFAFDGKPSATGLKPSLAQQAKTTTFHALGFEVNCGTDNRCVDNLKVDFNFTSSSEVQVGIDELLDVTVSVQNSEENSYNSQVILTYPAGLSYRKFTSLQGRIECNSLDSEDGLSLGKTLCAVNKPILKSNTEAFFIVSYGIEANRQFERTIFVTANASSGNQDHSSSSELYKRKSINVKYSIFITVESSLSYSNFTFGQNNVQKPYQQSVVVTNDIRALTFSVVIKVPVKLGDKDIWANLSSLQIPDCQQQNKDEKANVPDFVSLIQKNKVVDCNVATCRVFKCSRFMGRLVIKTYEISANLSSGWIEQIGLPSAKLLLTSSASLEYDTNQYTFFSPVSNNTPPIRMIETVIDVYTEPDFTKEIVGGSLGGLALLALLTAGLYKAGFFKSKYKEMINEAGAAEPGADGDAASPASPT